MSGSSTRSDIVLLSTADWDNPFWTNKQHVAQELARRGHRVLYIDSLGLRRPAASASDLKRMLRRLLRALRPPRKVRERLWVWSPIVIPLQRFAIVRLINKLLLSAGLLLWGSLLRIRRQLLWTYNPMTTWLFPARAFDVIAYHCVDEIKAQPGMPAAQIARAEAELLSRASICFVTAQELFESRRRLNPNTHYFPNVADFEHFALAREPTTRVPDDLARLPGPRIGFIGAISGYKLDLPLLRFLATARPHWAIVLIGEVGEGDPWTDLSQLRALPNLHLLGPRAYRELPAYLKGFDVAILPSAINDYTRSMFPMKFFEYLAAGCPVVSTDLPALQAYRGIVRLARTPDEFVQAIEQSLAGGNPPLSARLELAREHTYQRRTERMMALLEAR
jgi:glycosyltransferase involved in cell wall biosynthesis